MYGFLCGKSCRNAVFQIHVDCTHGKNHFFLTPHRFTLRWPCITVQTPLCSIPKGCVWHWIPMALERLTLTPPVLAFTNVNHFVCLPVLPGMVQELWQAVGGWGVIKVGQWDNESIPWILTRPNGETEVAPGPDKVIDSFWFALETVVSRGDKDEDDYASAAVVLYWLSWQSWT